MDPPWVYPFHTLPDYGMTGETSIFQDNALKTITEARKLTDNEKSLLQSAYACLMTYDPSKFPPSSTATYSELCFILDRFDHIQWERGRGSLFLNKDEQYYEHKEIYDSTGQAHSFAEIIRYPFMDLRDIIYQCALLERDMKYLERTYKSCASSMNSGLCSPSRTAGRPSE